MKKLSLENVNDSRNDILKFLEIYDNTLNIIALCKKKYLRGNNITACIYLLKINNKITSVSIASFEHVFVGWDNIHEHKLSKCSQKQTRLR